MVGSVSGKTLKSSVAKSGEKLVFDLIIPFLIKGNSHVYGDAWLESNKAVLCCL